LIHQTTNSLITFLHAGRENEGQNAWDEVVIIASG
jgi:hypothetical protein